jgi:hypothetical protein
MGRSGSAGAALGRMPRTRGTVRVTSGWNGSLRSRRAERMCHERNQESSDGPAAPQSTARPGASPRAQPSGCLGSWFQTGLGPMALPGPLAGKLAARASMVQIAAAVSPYPPPSLASPPDPLTAKAPRAPRKDPFPISEQSVLSPSLETLISLRDHMIKCRLRFEWLFI